MSVPGYGEQFVRGAGNGIWNGTLGGWLQLCKLACGAVSKVVCDPDGTYESIASGTRYLYNDPSKAAHDARGLAGRVCTEMKREFDERPVEVTSRWVAQFVSGRVFMAWLFPMPSPTGDLAKTAADYSKHKNLFQGIIDAIDDFVDTGNLEGFTRIGIDVHTPGFYADLQVAAREIRGVAQNGVRTSMSDEATRRLLNFGEYLARQRGNAETILSTGRNAQTLLAEQALLAQQGGALANASTVAGLVPTDIGDSQQELLVVDVLEQEPPAESPEPLVVDILEQGTQTDPLVEPRVADASVQTSEDSLHNQLDSKRAELEHKIDKSKRHLARLAISMANKKGGGRKRARAQSASLQYEMHKQIFENRKRLLAQIVY